MEKGYKKNTELRNYYEFNIRKMDVPEEFKSMLVDILMRRAYEFDLKGPEIIQDMDSLKNNLKSIKIEDMPKGYKWASGLYSPSKKQITLGTKFVKDIIKNNDYETFYEVFTHEVYHALSADEKGYDRLGSVNQFTRHYNSSLLEAIVEKAADRCVYNRGENDTNSPYFHQNKYGYSNITFITDALAAVYGTTERSFLKSAIMGRSNLYQALAGISGDSIDETTAFLDGVELNYARIHKILYREKGDKSLNGIEAKNEVPEALGCIYRLCEWRFQGRMEQFEINSIEHAKFFEQYMKYNHNKLYFVMAEAASVFNEQLGNDITKKNYESAKEQRMETLNRICEVSQLLANMDKLPSEEETLRLVNLAKAGQLTEQDRENIKGYGIEFKVEETFAISESFLKRRLATDFSNDTWNNDYVCQDVENVLETERGPNFSQRLKNFFANTKIKFQGALGKISNRFNEEQPLLGVGPDSNNTTKSTTFAVLSEEQLNDFNSGVKNVLKQHRETLENGEEKPDNTEDKTMED